MQNEKLTLDSMFDFVLKNPPYNSIKVGALKLKRTRIPSNDNVKQSFNIDHGTLTVLGTKALEKGLTIDEYIRCLCWASASL